MTIEDDLILTLQDEAAKTSLEPDLLGRVRTGVRRDRRRRTAVLGAAAVLTAAAVSVPIVVAHRSPAPQPLHTAPVTVTAPPSSTLSTVVWVPGRMDMPTFPLTPGYLPAGLMSRRVDLFGANVSLSYSDKHDGSLSLEIGPVAGDWEVEGEGDHHATIGTATATVRTTTNFDGAAPGDRYVGVRWKLADGRWAQLLSFGRRSEDDVLRFARNLQPQTVPASAAWFEPAEMPAGLALSFASPDYVCLSPPPATRETMQDGLCVGLQEGSDASFAAGSTFAVAGHPAAFTGTSELSIDLGNHRVLTVESTREALGLSGDDLVRFADGIRIVGG